LFRSARTVQRVVRTADRLDASQRLKIAQSI